MNESDLWAEHKEDLDEEWHDVLDALVSQGCSPRGVKATIAYLSDPVTTQQEAASEHGTSKVTIRNLQTAVVALAPDDATITVPGGSGRSGTMNCAELATHVADALGWEAGVEYTVTDTGQARMNKTGWVDLYRRFAEEGDDA